MPRTANKVKIRKKRSAEAARKRWGVREPELAAGPSQDGGDHAVDPAAAPRASTSNPDPQAAQTQPDVPPEPTSSSRRKIQQFSSILEEEIRQEFDSSARPSADLGTDSAVRISPSGESNQRVYVMMDIYQLILLLNPLSCPNCAESGTLKLIVKPSAGYASQMSMICTLCDTAINTVYSSPRARLAVNESAEILGHTDFEINRLMVMAVQELGHGHSALRKFSAIVGMGCLSRSSYFDISEKFHKEVKFTCEGTFGKSIEIVKKLYGERFPDRLSLKDTVADIDVSFDGSWQKRGHTSHNGVGLVIDLLSGLCLDYEVLSNFCLACNMKGENPSEEWTAAHRQKCDKNYEGTAGGMEQASACAIWKRSWETRNVRYETFLSDGDSKAYTAVNHSKPYGDEHPVQKEECVNHVSKRLGTALRNAASKQKLGGRQPGSLTVPKIQSLQVYYTRAIRSNLSDVNAMRKDILSVLLHTTSTDENPRHNQCPKGKDSRCFYQRAIAENKPPGPHKTGMKVKLSDEVVQAIKPIYMRMANADFPRKCQRGKTQNPNEGLHSLIWQRCPKTVFVGRKRLETAVASAVGYSNQGASFLQAVQKNFGIRPSSLGDTILKDLDIERVQKAQKKESDECKRRRKMRQQHMETRKEGELYGAGLAGLPDINSDDSDIE